MIQEPQQPEIIEIPAVNPMSSVVNNSSNKIILKTKSLNSNNNNKNQRTLLQITQPKTSKPRIFLLTRPANSRLVRLETQTVQPHHQRNLNSSPLLHPQKTTAETPETLTDQNRNKNTKILRIPFLPRSQVKTFSVKSNTDQVLKKEKDLIISSKQYSENEYNSQNPTTQVNTNNTIIPPTSVEISNNQLQTQPISVKNTITKDTVNYLNLSENKTQSIQNQVQVKAQAQKPLTLASMAGIELTGADMSLSQADMSGAMPPTATVEEINVPVFIDEYLQEARSPSTSLVNTTLNINNNNNTNNNNHSNEKGNEVNNFLDTFEFDINLLTENSSENKDKTTDLEVSQLPTPYHQQQQLSEVDDNNSKQHQLELQLMLEDILFNNNNNNNNNVNNTSNNNSNNFTTCNQYINTNNNMNNNITTDDEIQEQFRLPPVDFLDESSLNFDDFDSTCFVDNEQAINLNIIENNISLSECFNNSQENDIMFTSGCSQSLPSSQLLANEIARAEPHIMDSVDPSTSMALDGGISDNCHFQFSDIENALNENLQTNSLKRHSTQPLVQDVPEKRPKLILNIKENRVPQQPEINTPNLIEILDQINGIPYSCQSYDHIHSDLISTSSEATSVKTENVDEFSPPNTPFSYNSFSNFSNLVTTAPNSPASSIATTSNASIATKRGRGRPAKTHSDIPDRSELQHLSESEQKKILERAKNNEASRKSRLKHKERDNALEQEEINLTQRNRDLNEKYERLQKMEKKLKKALKRQLFK